MGARPGWGPCVLRSPGLAPSSRPHPSCPLPPGRVGTSPRRSPVGPQWAPPPGRLNACTGPPEAQPSRTGLPVNRGDPGEGTRQVCLHRGVLAAWHTHTGQSGGLRLGPAPGTVREPSDLPDLPQLRGHSATRPSGPWRGPRQHVRCAATRRPSPPRTARATSLCGARPSPPSPPRPHSPSLKEPLCARFRPSVFCGNETQQHGHLAGRGHVWA